MTDVDAIVIGSGAGGLAAALCLAQAGERVLVLEQHYLPGGWCHSFNLGPYRFGPGVHYIGALGPGGLTRTLYEGLGVSRDLVFCELNPDGYDHILVGDQRFDMPKGRDALAERLKARFPAERAGIDAYLRICQRLADEINGLLEPIGFLEALGLPLRAPTLMRWGSRSAQVLIHQHVRDPLLRAILGAQSGDHGMPPSLAPAPVHAFIVAHYFDGGCFPRGGGAAIPCAFIRALRRAGGKLRVRAPVQRILLEGRRAMGVRLADGTEIRARYVISNADPHVTFERLVGREHLGWRLRRRLDRTSYSLTGLGLFFTVDMDLRAAGLDSGNYWSFPHVDIDALYRQGMTSWDPREQRPPALFLSATTLKDPTKFQLGHHTLEAFTYLSYDAFSKWAHTRSGDRPADYLALKQTLQDQMLDAVERICPGLRDHLVFAALGTPLTQAHYISATRGCFYGTEKNLHQVGPWAYPVRTSIPGLYLCGSSTVGHGVAGATFSGVLTAANILGVKVDELLRQRGPELRIYPSENLAQWPAELLPRRRRNSSVA